MELADAALGEARAALGGRAETEDDCFLLGLTRYVVERPR